MDNYDFCTICGMNTDESVTTCDMCIEEAFWATVPVVTQTVEEILEEERCN